MHELVGQILAEKKIFFQIWNVKSEDLLIFRILDDDLFPEVMNVRDEERELENLFAEILYNEYADVQDEQPLHDGRQPDEESSPYVGGTLVAVIIPVLQAH